MADLKAVKISATELSVEQTIPEKVEVSVHKRVDVETRIKDLTAQRERDNAYADEQIAKWQAILDSMNELGVLKTNNVEAIPEKEEIK
jgi:ribosomal protein S20